jgi:hypothetical protein
MICRGPGRKRMRLGAVDDGFRLKEKTLPVCQPLRRDPHLCSKPRKLLYTSISRFLPESIEDAQARRVLAKSTDPCLESPLVGIRHIRRGSSSSTTSRLCLDQSNVDRASRKSFTCRNIGSTSKTRYNQAKKPSYGTRIIKWTRRGEFCGEWTAPSISASVMEMDMSCSDPYSLPCHNCSTKYADHSSMDLNLAAYPVDFPTVFS